jgi:hypothetical protein
MPFRSRAVVGDVPDPKKIGIEDALVVDFGVVILPTTLKVAGIANADVERVRQKFSIR